jgi:hypothetical protein
MRRASRVPAGWLRKFAELDLVHYNADSDDWRLLV